jgi:8-oxo-dGTP diphosphatase
LPGGGVRRNKTAEAAARQELAEEIGLKARPLLATGSCCGTWDGRRDRVYFFELKPAELPELKLDNREIIAARLIPPAELQRMVLTGPLAAYLGRARRPLKCHRRPI